MWMKAEHEVVDNQGRRVRRNITINMNLALCYVGLDDERTRLYYSLGHDLEDHRSATWIDVVEPKEKLDKKLKQSRPAG